MPPPPSGPATTTLRLPPADPLPVDASTIALPASVPWAPGITSLALAPDAVWVSSGLFRITPGSNAVSGPFTTAESADIAFGEGSIWASSYDEGFVRRFDAATGALTAVVKLPAITSPEGIVDAGGSIWVASHHGGTIIRIDPQTNRIAATIVLTPIGPSGPQGIAAGLGSVWVDVPNVNAVFRVDATTNKISAIIPFPLAMSPCGGIAVGTTAVWVTSCLEGKTVARIDPATNKVVSILDVGGKVVQPAADGNTVWFVAGGDPDTNPNAPADLIQLRADDTVATSVRLPDGFISGAAEAAFGSVWVSDFSHPKLIRLPVHLGKRTT